MLSLVVYYKKSKNINDYKDRKCRVVSILFYQTEPNKPVHVVTVCFLSSESVFCPQNLIFVPRILNLYLMSVFCLCSLYFVRRVYTLPAESVLCPQSVYFVRRVCTLSAESVLCPQSLYFVFTVCTLSSQFTFSPSVWVSSQSGFCCQTSNFVLYQGLPFALHEIVQYKSTLFYGLSNPRA